MTHLPTLALACAVMSAQAAPCLPSETYRRLFEDSADGVNFRAVTDSMAEFTFNEQSLPDGQINTGPENRHA